MNLQQLKTGNDRANANTVNDITIINKAKAKTNAKDEIATVNEKKNSESFRCSVFIVEI